MKGSSSDHFPLTFFPSLPSSLCLSVRVSSLSDRTVYPLLSLPCGSDFSAPFLLPFLLPVCVLPIQICLSLSLLVVDYDYRILVTLIYSPIFLSTPDCLVFYRLLLQLHNYCQHFTRSHTQPPFRHYFAGCPVFLSALIVFVFVNSEKNVYVFVSLSLSFLFLTDMMAIKRSRKAEDNCL